MKTMKNFAVLLVLVMLANVALASGNLKVNLLENDVDYAVMEISNADMSLVEIDVKNAYGDELYSLETTVPVNEFKKRYNFSELEDGLYFYSVKIDDEKVVKELEIVDGKVEVVDVRKSVDPYFVQENDMLKFSFLNFQKENVTLYVYEDSKLLTESKLGNSFTINKAVDLKDLKKGNYEVVITNEEDVFSHNFVIQ
ncbi:hypothetical protein [uncultured Draconibacterium sp.]|uniref:hypothetical protein n=1 Tax=uncultured Draconibacterium sp. TaxID=1573823 RepID=UPI0025D07597|nr:hypothetical protein [uncultured Draconibacterium sp.]